MYRLSQDVNEYRLDSSSNCHLIAISSMNFEENNTIDQTMLACRRLFAGRRIGLERELSCLQLFLDVRQKLLSVRAVDHPMIEAEREE